MKRLRCSDIRLISTILAVVLIHGELRLVHAERFDDTLIEGVRAASHMVPGELPLEVHFQAFARYSGPMSAWVEDAPPDTVPGVIGVFQIRHPGGWIMVDGGAGKEMILWEVEFSGEEYASIGEAFLGANLIVATHEHADHIAGLIRGPWASEAARRTLLTTEQLNGLMEGPDHPEIRISREHADQFLSISYDQLLPIAPGVVLIKAPGHTAGSQIVYVRLERGTELLLVGDVVWVAAALDSGSQRPLEVSTRLGEDRDALALQIRWLQQMQDNDIHVVVAHDELALGALIDAGMIKDGLYLSSQ